MSAIQQWADASDSAPWSKVNANFEDVGVPCFAHRRVADSGLVVAFGGGNFDETTIADGSVTCTDDDVNYIVVERSTGTVSTAITTTNWNNTTTYGRMATATFVAGVLLSYLDERFSPGGIFDHSTAAVGDMLLAGVQTVTGAKTFGSAGAVGKLKVAGSTSGSTIIDAAAVAGSGTVVLPTTGTLATLDGAETLTNKTLTNAIVGTQSPGDNSTKAASTAYVEAAVTAGGGGSVATDAIWDAKGDLAGGTGANTAAKLSVGANDTMLMAASGEATGMKWATPAQVATAVQADGLTAGAAGFRTIPQNSQSAAYTTVAADSGKHIYHPSSDANARTFTIDSNANVAYPIGTALTFINETSQVVTIAITSDTLVLAGTGSTGSRSLAQYGVATAIKVTSTRWLVSGTGLT